MNDKAPPINVNILGIPEDLRALPQWINWTYRWRGEKWTKVPIRVRFDQRLPGGVTWLPASSTEPTTWTTFREAAKLPAIMQHHGRHIVGIGFVHTADDPFFMLDCDKCRDKSTGEITKPFVLDLIREANTRVMISTSGTGVQIIGRGNKPGAHCRNDKIGVELYETGRFHAETGNSLPGQPTTHNDCQQFLTDTYYKIWPYDHPDERAKRERIRIEQAKSPNPSQIHSASLTDQGLIHKAMHAANGEKFTALWNGSDAGYESASSSDWALIGMLAFWTQNNRSRMVSLFMQSGRVRSKSREMRGAKTYIEYSVDRFLDVSSGDFYEETRNEYSLLTPKAKIVVDRLCCNPQALAEIVGQTHAEAKVWDKPERIPAPFTEPNSNPNHQDANTDPVGVGYDSWDRWGDKAVYNDPDLGCTVDAQDDQGDAWEPRSSDQFSHLNQDTKKDSEPTESKTIRRCESSSTSPLFGGGKLPHCRHYFKASLFSIEKKKLLMAHFGCGNLVRCEACRMRRQTKWFVHFSNMFTTEPEPNSDNPDARRPRTAPLHIGYIEWDNKDTAHDTMEASIRRSGGDWMSLQESYEGRYFVVATAPFRGSQPITPRDAVAELRKAILSFRYESWGMAKCQPIRKSRGWAFPVNPPSGFKFISKHSRCPMSATIQAMQDEGVVPETYEDLMHDVDWAAKGKVEVDKVNGQGEDLTQAEILALVVAIVMRIDCRMNGMDPDALENSNLEFELPNVFGDPSSDSSPDGIGIHHQTLRELMLE